MAIINREEPAGRVTVAVDGSDRSLGALVWALELWPAEQLQVVYAHDSSVLDDLPVDSGARDDFDSRAQQVLVEVVDQAARLAGIDSSAISTELRSGDPRAAIVDEMGERDLLVLGSHGHSGIARWMLGSLADYAVHHAPGSIVIWRSRDLP